uniref:Uncharacterized protein n=1 Tax=Triticum urartu TaxID=4572 RepID=A0A8R7U7N1_TRIUA
MISGYLKLMDHILVVISECACTCTVNSETTNDVVAWRRPLSELLWICCTSQCFLLPQ